MRKGYVHVYTGGGKGKTTAALGLALRAAGAGLRVFIAQFIKQRKSSEDEMLKRFRDLITIKRFGRGFILKKEVEHTHRKAAQAGLKEVRKVIQSGDCDVVILDEANIAVHYNLISVDDLLNLISEKPKRVELVITGRYADHRIVQAADLVTEMKEIKHYLKKGVKARVGIEH